MQCFCNKGQYSSTLWISEEHSQRQCSKHPDPGQKEWTWPRWQALHRGLKCSSVTVSKQQTAPYSATEHFLRHCFHYKIHQVLAQQFWLFFVAPDPRLGPLLEQSPVRHSEATLPDCDDSNCIVDVWNVSHVSIACQQWKMAYLAHQRPVCSDRHFLVSKNLHVGDLYTTLDQLRFLQVQNIQEV